MNSNRRHRSQSRSRSRTRVTDKARDQSRDRGSRHRDDSRPRVKRHRSRSKSTELRYSRYHDNRDREENDRSDKRNRENGDRDIPKTDAFGRDVSHARQPHVTTTSNDTYSGKPTSNITRKERLEMVKRLTNDNSSESDRDESLVAEVDKSNKEMNENKDDNDDEDRDEDEDILSILGIQGFGTTKGKQVTDNSNGGVNKNKKRVYRQYMNRKGGFNQLLAKMK